MSKTNKLQPAPALPQMLKKHVATVHTSGELSLVERKIANILLLNAYDNLVSPNGSVPEHTIPVRYLGHMVGWDESKNVSSFKAALKTLQTTLIEFNLMKDGSEMWQSMALIGWAKIHKGICTYSYMPQLAAKLHDPEVFATINVAVQRRFKGGYSLTLYENCVRYKNVKSTGWWELDKFRRLLGADAETYDDFKRLSAFVIQKAQKEINDISDIKIAVEYRREGRKVVALRFAIEENPQQSLFGPNPLDDDELATIRASDIFQRLREHGIGERLALAAMKQDPEQARRAIEVAEVRDQQGAIKTSTGAYIRKLIEDKADLGPTDYDKRKVSQRKVAKDLATYEDLLSDFKKLTVTTTVKSLATDALSALALQFFEALPESKQVRAGQFDSRTSKFRDTSINIEFRPWLNKRVAPVFNQADFDAFARQKGVDPVALRKAVEQATTAKAS